MPAPGMFWAHAKRSRNVCVVRGVDEWEAHLGVSRIRRRAVFLQKYVSVEPLCTGAPLYNPGMFWLVSVASPISGSLRENKPFQMMFGKIVHT